MSGSPNRWVHVKIQVRRSFRMLLRLFDKFLVSENPRAIG